MSTSENIPAADLVKTFLASARRRDTGRPTRQLVAIVLLALAWYGPFDMAISTLVTGAWIFFAAYESTAGSREDRRQILATLFGHEGMTAKDIRTATPTISDMGDALRTLKSRRMVEYVATVYRGRPGARSPELADHVWKITPAGVEALFQGRA